MITVKVNGQTITSDQISGTLNIVTSGTAPQPEPSPEPEPEPSPSKCGEIPSNVVFGTLLSRSGAAGFAPATGEKQRIVIEDGEILAFKFTAPAKDKAGYLATSLDSHAQGGPHEIAISECPGDFSDHLAPGKNGIVAASQSFWWSTYGKYHTNTCEIVPGKTYYLNIRFTDSGRRGILMAWSNHS